MTAEINNRQRAQALQPAKTTGNQSATRHGRLIIGVAAFGVLAGVGGLVLVGVDLADSDNDAHVAVYAIACFILAGFAGGLLFINALLADRQTFYHRGQVDGWIKGWRGEEPATEDPLLRQ